MHFTPDRSRGARRPRFGYQATVEIWPVTGPDATAAATLELRDWAWHSDQAYSIARDRARRQLAALGLTLDQINSFHLECQVDRWYALDPKHIRNPDNAPVPATKFPLDESERLTLVKQRCLVPSDFDESTRLYMGPR